MNPLRLAFFDLRYGLPIAVRTLSAHLSGGRLVRVLLGFVGRSMVTRPFKTLPRARSPKERFTRHQLKPLLLLDDTLAAHGFERDAAMKILFDVVGETGARFIEFNLNPPDADTWASFDKQRQRSFVMSLLDRFGNAEAEMVDVEGAEVAFDVTHCYFAAMTRELGRGHLAPLFCHADAVYFSRPDSALVLLRDETIANDGERCTFRFNRR